MEISNLSVKPIAVNLTGNHALLLKLKPPFFSRKYGYMQIFGEGDDAISVKYELEVKYIRTLNGDTRIFELNRLSEVYINSMEPDSIMDQLAYECGKIFYPLLAEVGLNGQFIGIHNAEGLLHRWQQKKAELKKYYVGEWVEKYMALMDRTMGSSEKISDSFRNDLLISVLFNPIYKPYTAGLQVTENLLFPVMNRWGHVSFSVTQTVEPFTDEYGQIILNHTGETNHENPEWIAGSYSAAYTLSPQTKSIESLVAKWSMDLPVSKLIEIRLFRIDQDEQADETPAAGNIAGNMVYLDGAPDGKEQSGNSLVRLFNSLFNK